MNTNWNKQALYKKPCGGLADSIQLIWHSNYWDGVLSGMCFAQSDEWGGRKKLWFESFEEKNIKIELEDDKEDPHFIRVRLFHLIELTPKQYAWQEKWHTLFCKYVGTHCNYNEKGIRDGEVLSPDKHHLFYEAYEADTECNILSSEQIIGWFYKVA